MTISFPAPFHGLLSAFRQWRAEIHSKIPALGQDQRQLNAGSRHAFGRGSGVC